MSARNLPIVILGSGGHARSLLGLLSALNLSVKGCIAPEAPTQGLPKNCPWLGTDDILNKMDPNDFFLVNGIGSVGAQTKRRQVYEAARAQGFNFPQLVHPSVIHSKESWGEGVQVMAGVILQPNVAVGNNVLLNTGTIVEHDCNIGDHACLAPRATLSGSVNVGSNAYIGSGAVVIQGLSIGHDAVIGAGSVVIRNVAPGTTVVGNPSKVYQ